MTGGDLSGDDGREKKARFKLELPGEACCCEVRVARTPTQIKLIKRAFMYKCQVFGPMCMLRFEKSNSHTFA